MKGDLDERSDKCLAGMARRVSMGIAVVAMTPSDWEAVRSIYLQGIVTGNATFETAVPDWEQWDASHLQSCRLVALEGETVVGWAALSPVSDRCVYGGVAEVSVYIASDARGKGFGRALLQRLIEQSEQAGYWTLQAGLFSQNVASVALHKSCGFREVGVRRRLGQLNGVWRDVLSMERRSEAVGV